MRSLIDAQLPPALARALASRGREAQHVVDVGLSGAPDGDIWRYAVDHGQAIVTKDRDFADRRALSRGGPFIVWIRIGNCSTERLVERILSRWPEIEDAYERGEAVVELI